MSTQVKLCGLRSIADVDDAIAIGADRIGVVMTPGRRFVEASTAATLAGHARGRGFRGAIVGVFTDECDESIAQAAAASKIDAIQLSSNATPERITRIRGRTGLPVTGVVHIRDHIDVVRVRRLLNVADDVLLDTAAGVPGGSGVSFDPGLLDELGDDVRSVGIAGGLTPESVHIVVGRGARFVDVSSGIERNGRKDRKLMQAFVDAVRNHRHDADAHGYFGDRYGGRFVPETLMPAVEELTTAWYSLRGDADFLAEVDALAQTYVGRPTPLYDATRLAARCGGARILLKREDLAHTGSHKINNALGQALLAVRLGKHRIIAETGAGQHGVATATVCALLGLECVVYMGDVDVARQAINVQRMQMLGATVVPVADGTRTLKDAVNAAIRDWISNLDSTHYLVGSAVGMHPFPTIVRDLQRVIGVEARAQTLKLTGRLPTVAIACVGGGSNAIGLFHPMIDDDVELIGVEAGGSGGQPGQNAASICSGSDGVLHGAFSRILQDSDGQIVATHSISAGLDYPGVGPEHAHLAASGRARYVAVTDDEALAALHTLARTEGIVPALESAHAISHGMTIAADRDAGDIVLINLSGRGDKDLPTVLSCDEPSLDLSTEGRVE